MFITKQDEIFILSEHINSFLGVDGAYFGIDVLCLAKYLIEMGYIFIGQFTREDKKYFKKYLKSLKKEINKKNKNKYQ